MNPAIDYKGVYDEVFGRSRESGRCLGFSTYMNGKITFGIAGKTVLDVGCGKGDLMVMLRERMADVQGVDVGRYVLDETLPVEVVPTAAKLPHERDSFDLVTCSHMLEHVVITELPSVIGELFIVAKSYVIISVGLPDCPEHMSVLPWSEWVVMIDRSARAHEFACIRAEQDGLSGNNILIYRAIAECTEKEYQPRRIKRRYGE